MLKVQRSAVTNITEKGRQVRIARGKFQPMGKLGTIINQAYLRTTVTSPFLSARGEVSWRRSSGIGLVAQIFGNSILHWILQNHLRNAFSQILYNYFFFFLGGRLLLYDFPFLSLDKDSPRKKDMFLCVFKLCFFHPRHFSHFLLWRQADWMHADYACVKVWRPVLLETSCSPFSPPVAPT